MLLTPIMAVIREQFGFNKRPTETEPQRFEGLITKKKNGEFPFLKVPNHKNL